MPEIHVSTSLNVLLLLLAGVLALALSFFTYRYTVPPVRARLRVLLILLRATALFAAFVLVGEPILSLVTRRTQPPAVAVLIDNSKSMTIRDGAGDRKERLISVLRSPALRELQLAGDVQYALFDRRMRFVPSFETDSLTLSGDVTDIGGALKALKDFTAARNIQVTVLISDGNPTVGTSPIYEAEELAIPIFAIGVGDTSEQRDVLVRRVLTNNITYVGNKVPVQVTVKGSGYAGERVQVVLRDAAREYDRAPLMLEQGVREYSVSLSFIPEREGMQRFTVEVSQLPGEVSYQNNRSTFFTKVLESKMRIALVAGGPSPDVAFIRRALEADENVALRTFIARPDGEFYEGALTPEVLREIECIVVVGFPGTPGTLDAQRGDGPKGMAELAAAAEQGKGIFFIPARRLDLAKLKVLEPSLPVLVPGSAGMELQAFLAVVPEQRSHPILKLSSQQDVWSKLPPLFRGEGGYRAKPESDVLALSRVQSVTISDPMLVARNVNRRKSIALLGYGVWRWKSFSPTVPGSETLLEEFLSNSVRWLTTREDDRPIRVYPVNESFSGQDLIEFVAQVYDENYAPIDAAEVSIELARADQRFQFTLTPLGSGRFEGAFDPLEEGEYAFTARVSAGGAQLAEERGTFSVGSLNVEFQETRMNRMLLQQLAALTNGKYYDTDGLASLAQDITLLPNFRPRELVRTSEIELWNRSWMLAIVLGLFAMEWFLRKRSGML